MLRRNFIKTLGMVIAGIKLAPVELLKHSEFLFHGREAFDGIKIEKIGVIEMEDVSGHKFKALKYVLKKWSKKLEKEAYFNCILDVDLLSVCPNEEDYIRCELQECVDHLHGFVEEEERGIIHA